MKRTGWFTRSALILAVTGMVLPQTLRADFPAPRPVVDPQPAAPMPAAAAPAAPLIADVALGAGGSLRGQVVDAQGIAMPNVPVFVRQQDRIVANSWTNADGHFVVSGLSGGVYQITAGDGSTVCRLWAPRTAPPAAQAGAMVISAKQLIRGQGPGGFRYWLTNPWVLAGALGAAIIVPIALNNREKISTS